MHTMSTKTETVRTIDVTAALALIESAQTAWSESIGSEKSAVEACAVAAYAARDLIGEGLTYENVDAFRALFVSRQADKDGNYGPVSKSTITMWTRLGKSHSLGVTPESDRIVWTRLQSKVNSDKRMRDAVDDDKATGPKIRKAVASCYPKGKYAAPAKDDGKDNGKSVDEEHGNTGSNAESQTVPASVPAMLDLLDVIVARLASEPITKAEHARVASVVESLGTLRATDTDTVEASRKAA